MCNFKCARMQKFAYHHSYICIQIANIANLIFCDCTHTHIYINLMTEKGRRQGKISNKNLYCNCWQQKVFNFEVFCIREHVCIYVCVLCKIAERLSNNWSTAVRGWALKYTPNLYILHMLNQKQQRQMVKHRNSPTPNFNFCCTSDH